MHGGQGLDGAEVVLQLGDELLLASHRGHGLRQLDLQLRTAHWKTEPGPSPRGGPKPPRFCQGDTEKLRNPHLEHRSQLTGRRPIFSLFFGVSKRDPTSDPCSAPGKVDQGSSPPWWCRRAGRRPRQDQCHIPVPEEGEWADLVRAQLLQMHQQDTVGALGVPGSPPAGWGGDPERDKGS